MFINVTFHQDEFFDSYTRLIMSHTSSSGLVGGPGIAPSPSPNYNEFINADKIISIIPIDESNNKYVIQIGTSMTYYVVTSRHLKRYFNSRKMQELEEERL